MFEVSATVTVGGGSERHNHNISYRDKLEHTTGEHDKIIELIPYEKNYKEQINDLFKPYIDIYNMKVEERYQKAWDRYNNGEIKTKPRKRDYKHMSYDWYEEHKNDTRINPHTKKQEKVNLFRSIIVGIGDKEDKKKIPLEVAKSILSSTVKDFQRDFPDFKLLGATLHGDEVGFWHMHIDFIPLYKKGSEIERKGLSVGYGFDGAMKHMGYKPEQSIINQRDKVPILFNTMRNRIYRSLEDNMNKHRLLLQYGVSKFKDPDKDSSKNQKLEIWQETQDKAREMQHDKNIILNEISKPMQDIDQHTVFNTVNKLKDMITYAMSNTKKRLNKKEIIVEFHIFDQMRTFFEQFCRKLGELVGLVNQLQKENKHLKAENARKDKRIDHLEDENFEYKRFLRRSELIIGILSKNRSYLIYDANRDIDDMVVKYIEDNYGDNFDKMHPYDQEIEIRRIENKLLYEKYGDFEETIGKNKEKEREI